MFLVKEDYWQIKKTKEKGYGVFAKKEIKAGTVIGDYLGKVIKTAYFDKKTCHKTGFFVSSIEFLKIVG